MQQYKMMNHQNKYQQDYSEEGFATGMGICLINIEESELSSRSFLSELPQAGREEQSFPIKGGIPRTGPRML